MKISYSTLKTDPILVFVLLISGVAAFLFSEYNQSVTNSLPVSIVAPVSGVIAAVSAVPAAVSAVQASVSAVLPVETGRLVFDSTFFDFGLVTEGAVVEHSFSFKNTGAGAVRIVKTETSCGCTTANSPVKVYVAGASGELRVVVDTRGKKGIVVKTVTLTLENAEPMKIELSLVMNLQPPPHPPLGEPRNINTEAACKSCHLESGKGQTGIILYHRVCAQCHGKKGRGASARRFNEAAWQQSLDDAALAQFIRVGAPTLGMPSFVEAVSPPLTEPQITSLIQYIRSLVQP